MNKVTVSNIKKKFKSKEALRNVSINFMKNSITGLLGPNGSGKTTLFNIITGFVKPDEGNIFIDNINVTSFSLQKRSELGLTYLPQEASIFRDLTVYENILCVAELFVQKSKITEKVNQLIKDFSLEDFTDRKGKFLSGGERRRTEIARALACEPSFIMMDEPFAGIDPIAIMEVKNTIIKLKKNNIGVIITDHNVREALKIVDYAHIIYNGSIIREGHPEDIVRDEFVKKIYLGKDYQD
ncbi:LPS export ABC transporter ATP-binding protein [Alphaproteobacteria bacterium]|nr:LPS export ABC transporter ATP-binding protein [Alphaproteobacteria bacterium]